MYYQFQKFRLLCQLSISNYSSTLQAVPKPWTKLLTKNFAAWHPHHPWLGQHMWLFCNMAIFTTFGK